MDHRCRIAAPRCSWTQRGRRDPLHLSWLEIRRRGNCIDMASVPPHQDFKHKVKAKAYPAVERAGVIWSIWDRAPRRRHSGI